MFEQVVTRVHVPYDIFNLCKNANTVRHIEHRVREPSSSLQLNMEDVVSPQFPPTPDLSVLLFALTTHRFNSSPLIMCTVGVYSVHRISVQRSPHN